MLFSSLERGLTPKIRMLCFVLINSVLLNLLCGFFFFFLFFFFLLQIILLFIYLFFNLLTLYVFGSGFRTLVTSSHSCVRFFISIYYKDKKQTTKTKKQTKEPHTTRSSKGKYSGRFCGPQRVDFNFMRLFPKVCHPFLLTCALSFRTCMLLRLFRAT